MLSSCPLSSRAREEAAEDVVALHQHVGERVLGAGLAPEAVRRVVVEVAAARAVVEEPGLVASLAMLPDERRGVGGPLLVQVLDRLEVDLLLLDVGDVELPGLRLDHVLVELASLSTGWKTQRVVGDLGVEVVVAPLGVHVGDAVEAVELVEALVLRHRLLVLAAVPLADGAGDVARLLEQLGQGDLVLQAARLPVHGRGEDAVPDGQAPGHQGGAGGRAAGLRVAGGQLAGPPPPACRSWAWGRRAGARRRSSRSRPSPRRPG